MTRKELKLYLQTDNKSGFKTKEYYLKKNYPLLYKKIIDWSVKYKSISYLERLYLYIENMVEIPTCLICNGIVKFERKIDKGYRKYCSKKCSNNDPEVVEKIRKGNIFSQNTDEIKNKIKKNKYNKYGVEHHLQLDKFKDKSKKTNLEKYGVEHHLKLKSQQEKQKQTNLNKYGVEYVAQSDVIKERAKETNLRKYGVENPFQYDEFKNKIKKTHIEKYGVEYITQNTEIKNKIKRTNLERYGKESYTQTDEYLIKSKQSFLKNYNVDNIFKSKEFINNLILNSRDIFKKKWSKILKIDQNSILFNKDDKSIIIKNHCSNHLDGFEISKSLIYDRLITLKLKNICTICNPISEQSSIKENEIKEFINNNLNLKNIIENDRTILNGKELDIYLPDYKLAIEFDGLYWHSELFVDNNYHLNKTELAEAKDIKLLHIFEDEWVYKSDIVKSIIKSKLGLIINKIYARKCKIKEVSSKESINFLNENHIQGNVNSKIRIGLYYNNELVSLMTFDKLRKRLGNNDNRNDYWLLSRFCNKLNTTIIGGASKLFKYFLNTYKPNKIVSYADRRISNGELYRILGFNKIHKSKPDYFYIKGIERYHRFNFRKSLLNKKINEYDETLTEHENMMRNKYYRIYDCGKIRYEYNI